MEHIEDGPTTRPGGAGADGARVDGMTLLGQGREAEVYLRPDGTVLKLLRRPADAPRVAREAAALAAVRRCGRYAPAFVESVTVAGRPGLVVERVAGTDLMSLVGQRPWLGRRAAVVMATIQARVNGHPAPEELPDLVDELRVRITAARALPGHLASFALEVLDGLPHGDRICHGDLHFGNVLGSLRAPVLIDWGDATRGDPIADVARTHLVLRLAHLPDGTPPPLRLLLPPLRAAIARRYLAAYRRQRPVSAAALRRWEIVRAAARFVEPVEPEYPALASWLERQYRQPLSPSRG